MAVTFGFYNSVAHDRDYDALQISSIFDGIITDGVFATVGSGLEVTPGTGLTIVVGAGKAWFNHTWTVNDSGLVLSVDTPDAVLGRIDSVIIEVDSSDEVRANSIKILTGIASSSPVPRSLTNTSTLHQYLIATLVVEANVVSFTLEDITDFRGTEGCPYVTGPLTSFIFSDFKVSARQGNNSASDWNKPGTYNFTPGNVVIQCGNISISDGTGIVAVTFPIEFEEIPLVFIICNDPVEHFISAQIGYETTTGFTAYLIEHLTEAPYHQRLAHLSTLNWLAIGEPKEILIL
jgi:hypothetical protein